MLARQVAMARTRLAAAEEEKRSVASVVRELLLQAKRGTTSPDPNEPEPEKKFVSLPNLNLMILPLFLLKLLNL